MIIGAIKSHYALSTYLKHCLEWFGFDHKMLRIPWKTTILPERTGLLPSDGKRKSSPSGIRGNEKPWLNIPIKVINQPERSRWGKNFSTYSIPLWRASIFNENLSRDLQENFQSHSRIEPNHAS